MIIDSIEKKSEVNANTETKQQQQQQVPVATLYSSEDQAVDLNENVKNRDIETSSPSQQIVMASASEYQFRIPDAFPIGSNNNHLPPPQPLNPLMKSTSMNSFLTRNKTDHELQLQKPSSKLLIGSLPNRGAVSAASSCGHHGAGQELCYLCHQRAKRNVPIYLHEEKRHREAEEQQLLQQYQHLKDTEKQLQDASNEQYRRDERAKMDAFNLGVAEAVKQKKTDRPKSEVAVSCFKSKQKFFLILCSSSSGHLFSVNVLEHHQNILNKWNYQTF